MDTLQLRGPAGMAVMLSLFLFVISGVQSQECMQNLPMFANQGGGDVERIFPGTQVIIPDYSFTCYGNVTQWGAWVERGGGNEEYTLDFQVWRRSGGGQGTTGCYELVDNNLFRMVNPDGGEIIVPVAVEDQIQVRPGDVVGFSVVSSRRQDNGMDRQDNGVELQDTDDDPPGGRVAVTAWHGPNPVSASSAESCRIQVGNVVGYELRSSTSAAPIITVVVVATPPNSAVDMPSPTPPPNGIAALAPSGSVQPTVIVQPTLIVQSTGIVQPPQPTKTPQTQASTQPDPSVFPLPPVAIPPGNDDIGIGVIIAIVIVFVIVLVLGVLMLVCILTLALRRVSKNQVRMVDSLDNPEYSGQQSGLSKFSTSIFKVKPAKQPKLPPQSGRPKPPAAPYVVSGPRSEGFSELQYHPISPGPVEYTYAAIPKQKKLKSSIPSLREPIYTYADAQRSEKPTAAPNHLYHYIDPHETNNEQYYSDPTSPSQLLDPVPATHMYHTLDSQERSVPATHMYHTLDSQESSGKFSVQYEAPTLPVHRTQGTEAALDSVGIYVPTQEQRAAFGTRYEILETHQYNKLKFFTEDMTYWAPASTTSGLYSQLAAKRYREIPRGQIQLLEKLGSGQFGQVCKGLWRFSGHTMEIAVKTLKPDSPEEEKVKFLQEAAIMGQFSHPNVVKLYGVVTVGEPAMIGLEIMPNGDLRSYLKGLDLYQYSDRNKLQTWFVRVAREVAAGMVYLSRKAFVHRDLAARNILLDQNLTCKIGDFGMARDLMDDTYYKSRGGKIPVKWTAPEALLYKKYTTSSDVWSYGMVLYEIWSVGYKPFQNLSNNDVVALVNTGHCQPPPPGCPRAIYSLMVECWNPKHQERFTFDDISDYLQQSEEVLTHWSQEDKSVSQKGHILGAALPAARRLYLDLQHRYKH